MAMVKVKDFACSCQFGSDDVILEPSLAIEGAKVRHPPAFSVMDANDVKTELGHQGSQSSTLTYFHCDDG